jgi:Site-specific recombinase XerD
MSIQTKEYVSKKTGEKSIKYYAALYHHQAGKVVWSKGFSSEKEAKKEEYRMLQDIKKNRLITRKVKFEEVVQRWFRSCKDIYANSTYQGYKSYYNNYIKPVFEEKEIGDIQSEQIQDYIDGLSEKYSAETVNKNINILANIFSFAERILRLITDNPMEGVKRKRVRMNNGITWSEDQILDFLSFDKVKQSPYFEILVLSFIIGARPSEICGLSENALSKTGGLYFNRGFDRYGKTTDLKSNNSRRPIQLTKELYQMISLRIERQKNEKRNYGKDYNINDFLFKQINGRPINPATYSKAFNRLLSSYNKIYDKLSLPIISLYGARHSFATNLITSRGVSTVLVSKLMGNSERVSNERYVHPSSTMLASVITDYVNNVFHNASLCREE